MRRKRRRTGPKCKRRNARCVDCNGLFRKGPTCKSIRCKICRKGKTGILAGHVKMPPRFRGACPICGRPKFQGWKCARCHFHIRRGEFDDEDWKAKITPIEWRDQDIPIGVSKSKVRENRECRQAWVQADQEEMRRYLDSRP